MKKPYCPDHRSYFCPCVRPFMYSNTTKAKQEWDDAQKAYEEKKLQKAQAPR